MDDHQVYPQVRRPVKPKTKSGYESLLRSRILPTFGKRRLAQIRRSDIQEWIASMLAEGVSAGRARQAVIVLRLMLDAAVDERLIAGIRPTASSSRRSLTTKRSTSTRKSPTGS